MSALYLYTPAYGEATTGWCNIMGGSAHRPFKYMAHFSLTDVCGRKAEGEDLCMRLLIL